MSASYRALAQRLLTSNPHFKDIAQGTIERLLQDGVVRNHQRGDYLIERDRPVHEMQMVLTGSLEVSVESESGRRAICWFVGSGEWFGMIPVLDGKGAIHTARLHEDSVLWHIPAKTFLALLDSDSQLALACLKLLCERSRIFYSDVAAQGLMDLQGRLARRLLLLVDHHGQPQRQGIAIALKISQEELSSMLAASRQQVNRGIRALVAQGIVTQTYKQITVIDVAALRRLAVPTLLPVSALTM